MEREESNDMARTETIVDNTNQASPACSTPTQNADDIMITLEDPKEVDDEDSSLWTEVNDPRKSGIPSPSSQPMAFWTIGTRKDTIYKRTAEDLTGAQPPGSLKRYYTEITPMKN